MCGIAGLVYGETPIESELDWTALIQHLEVLTQTQVDVHRPQLLAVQIGELESLALPLREYPELRSLLRKKETQARLLESAQGLVSWDQELQKCVNAPEADISIELMEEWNSLSIRVRDLAWSLEKDVLACLTRLQRLIPIDSEKSEKCLFEAWKLAVTLENIGRMEVRGRDSLGMSLLVTFKNFQIYQAWETWAKAHHGAELEKRLDPVEFTNGAILNDFNTQSPSLVFVYKVAQEVGALGDNVAAIYASLGRDPLVWNAMERTDVEVNLFSHTRWASNGIISEPNCHPVNELTLIQDSPTRGTASSPHRVVVCLNGDVDNYQELSQRLASQDSRVIPGRISTDTKIIPVLVDHYFQQTRDMREAFCKTVSDCEGSIAIVMQNTMEPHRTYLALRGSGQALFVGLCEHGYVFASELYGVVEQTQRFVRMDGIKEWVPGRPETAGQVFVLDSTKKGLGDIEVWSFDGTRVDNSNLKEQKAEITTRDINRGEYSHFLLKEISEAPESIRNTIRGKFFLNRPDDGFFVRMNLDEKVIPKVALERLKQGKLRRVYLIGQGTAAVAGQAVSAIMQKMLGGGITVQALKATELSGYSMDKDLSDTLVIAISQSGTTTDTNRTIDMAKSRGATVVGIVNRRNSDLVYKVDGVLYTSDGRDIEMSVASTKAFYSQVVAGYLVTYQLALAMGTASQEEIYHELHELVRLPELMRSVLANQAPIQKLAEQWAPTRRDWALVGSGPTRAAADEIRIKLSELCYKSIATDYIEDKKHIDLSSEPLTLICVAGLPLMALKDAVKEVAIFKSHKSIPIVICSEGFQAFEPYAAGVLYVPKTSEAASVLLNTLVGHLWGYYCAQAIDKGAEQLRHARSMAVQYLNGGDSTLSPALMRQVRDMGRRFHDDLVKGRLNSSLSVEVGTKLGNLFHYFTGAASLRQFANEFQTQPTPAGVAEVLIATLSQAIQELSRPIDAIKHQAKTVTVGISRLEELYEGPIFEALEQLGVAPDSIPYRDMGELRAINPAVARVRGVTCYALDGLGTMGEILPSTSIKTVAKLGASATMWSRADQGMTLLGTKEWTVRHGTSYLGRGRKDQRPILIVPSAPRGQVEKLVLLHLEFDESLPLSKRISVLRDLSGRYDDLKGQVQETDTEWCDEALLHISTTDLITLPVDKLTEMLLIELSKTAAMAP